MKKILDENLEEYGKKISLSYHTNLNEGKVIEIDHLSPQNQYYLYSLNSFKNESYQNAIKYINANIEKPMFFIFSDDVEITRGKKDLSENRNESLFEIIKQGGIISKGELFTKLDSLINQ